MAELTIQASLEHLEQVIAFVDTQLEELDCPMKTQMQIDVAVEEIFVNISHYAYAPGTGEAVIRLDFDPDTRTCVIVFQDSGVPFDPMRVSLSIESAAGSLVTYEMGVPLLFDEEKATEILSANEIRAVADMHDGIFAASAFGCDLTHEYVNINADYRS